MNEDDWYTATCTYCSESFNGSIKDVNLAAFNHHRNAHGEQFKLCYTIGPAEVCDAIKPGQTLRCTLLRGHSGKHGISW